MQPIAHIHTEFPTKFGIPRQSGLVPQLEARIIFTPEYRNPDALRGLEGFSHLWLLWCRWPLRARQDVIYGYCVDMCRQLERALSRHLYLGL